MNNDMSGSMEAYILDEIPDHATSCDTQQKNPVRQAWGLSLFETWIYRPTVFLSYRSTLYCDILQNCIDLNYIILYI